MEIKKYHCLSDDAMYIRTQVFIKEQGFVDEFDTIDSFALTLVGYEQGEPIACARAFYDEEEKKYKVGRFAVLKEFRGQGIGTRMLEETCLEIKKMGAKEAWLHSQLQATGFYEKSGFRQVGEIGYEENCPHIWMKKEL